MVEMSEYDIKGYTMVMKQGTQ